MRNRPYTDPDIPQEKVCRLLIRNRISSLGQLVQGKFRRFSLAHTHQGREYIRRMRERRLGECRRCGACCRLLHRCPFLRMENGLANCMIYERRTPNCTVFPVDRRDLDDRDQIAPDAPCGYSFV